MKDSELELLVFDIEETGYVLSHNKNPIWKSQRLNDIWIWVEGMVNYRESWQNEFPRKKNVADPNLWTRTRSFIGMFVDNQAIYLFYSNRSIMGRIITFTNSVKVPMVRESINYLAKRGV